MTTIHRRTLLATLGAAGLAATLAPGVSLAQAFPSQPVSIVVPCGAAKRVASSRIVTSSPAPTLMCSCSE